MKPRHWAVSSWKFSVFRTDFRSCGVTSVSPMIDHADFSVVVKNRAPPSKIMEMGNLSRWQSQPD